MPTPALSSVSTKIVSAHQHHGQRRHQHPGQPFDAASYAAEQDDEYQHEQEDQIAESCGSCSDFTEAGVFSEHAQAAGREFLQIDKQPDSNDRIEHRDHERRQNRQRTHCAPEPAAAGKLDKGADRIALCTAAHGDFGHHHRITDHCDKKQVDEQKRGAAVLRGHHRKRHQIAKSDRGSGRGEDESHPGRELPAFVRHSPHPLL